MGQHARTHETAMSQPIDVPALEAYLARHVPAIKVPVTYEQFTHGQSNPTYKLTAHDGRPFVLRKKPPGTLLTRSAHNVEREHHVLAALQDAVPVPRVLALCEDSSVLGTPFYLMQFLDGRIFTDPGIPGVSAAQRAEMWREAVTTLARLHRVDAAGVGLAGFGRPVGFYGRQGQTLRRLGAGYAPVRDVESGRAVGELRRMREMLAFFGGDGAWQPQDRACIVHGDYKIDNLVFHRTESRIIGILDWEIATIGHPLSDLSNLALPWTVTNTSSVIKTHSHPAFRYNSTLYPGLPSKAQCITWYREVVGWDPSPEMLWADAFMVFRTGVMLQGIAARYAVRQTRGADAFELGEDREPYAEAAWKLIEELMRAKRDGGGGGVARL